MNGASTGWLSDFIGLEKETPFDSLEKKKSYLIVSKNGARIRASASAYRILQAVNSGQTLNDLAREINGAQPQAKVSEKQLENAYQEIAAKLAKIDERAAKFKLPWAFWVKWRILPDSLVRPISSVLSVFYNPYVVLALLVPIGITLVSMFRHFHIAVSDSALWWGYLWYLLSLMFHELGHSAACRRYGASPSDIGFTIYLIYPAFYSDVSSSWQLSRWQRVAVDLGGNYFQCIAATIFALGFYITHWPALRIAQLMILSTCVFSLNPFFKFDGYWVMADMLGVTNLASQPFRIGKHLLARLMKRSSAPLPWPPVVTSILLVYSLFTTSVWSIFLWKLFPMLRERLALFSHHLYVIVSRVALGEMPRWTEIRSVAISAPMLLFLLIMLWSIVGRVFRWFIFRFKGAKDVVPARGMPTEPAWPANSKTDSRLANGPIVTFNRHEG